MGQVLEVVIQGCGKDYDVIQVDLTHIRLETIQDPLHQLVEWVYVGQSKGHDMELVQPPGAKG